MVRTDHHCLRVRRHTGLIPDEDGSTASVVELLHVWSCVLDMHDATKRAEVVDCRSLTGPSLKWSPVVKGAKSQMESCRRGRMLVPC
jgi:hypothetical protein